MARRVLLAAIGIFLLTGGATYIVAVNEVAKVVDALGQSKAVAVAPKVLLATRQGAPETLLLVGNDQRPPPKDNPFGSVLPHSNEMLLVRIDPSKPTISMLSIPRELQVTFTAPNGEVITNRINSAFTYGGAELMLKTIKHLFGISVNHVFVVSFPKFKRAVDEMGCVYMTVDRRYYHVNEPGGEQYFEINLEPGYQRLCGKEALEFVANRHEDTSLTRDARDQRFLLEVKAQYGATLFENREKFERILGRAVETDLHGTSQVLDLLELLVQSQGKPVRQVPFHVNLLPTFDTATPQQREEAAQSFLQGTAPISKQKLNAAVHAARPRTRSHTAASPPGLSLTPTTGEALEKARSEAPNLPFPLEYPKARLAYATAVPDTLHLYDIRDQRRDLHPIYVAVIDRGGLGEFYDVQGTSWSDPPLLSNPSQTVQIGSRSYNLFYAGEEIRVISWHEDGGTYWIENTLTDSIQPREMLAMAEQTVPVIGTGTSSSHPSTTPSNLSNLRLPPRELDAPSLTSKLAAGASLVGLAVLALLAFLAISRQRELITLRDQVTHAMALKARQQPVLATGVGIGVGVPRTEPSRPTIYRSPRRLRSGILAVAAGTAVVGILAILTVQLYPDLVPSSKPVASAPPVPVPVAVYNATSTTGEAHRIAAELRADKVHLGRIGNIQASLPTGVYVFYPPGAEAQAREVAGKIPDLSPLIRPLPAQIEGAVGQHQEIVVIFH